MSSIILLMALKKHSLLFFFVCFLVSAKSQIRTLPNWVTPITENYSNKESTNSEFDILVDIQRNLASEEYYFHHLVKLNNSEGVQNYSDLNFYFDPSYQHINVHFIRVIRNNQAINKLQINELKTIQREESAERAMYDGRKTTYINLKDIRPGDILEYAYSRTGHNPVHDENSFYTVSLGYSSPAQRIYQRVVSPEKKELYFKNFNTNIEPQKRKITIGNEYVWDIKNIQGITYDNNVPIWHKPNAYVQISTFQNWVDVIQWARKLFPKVTIAVKDIPEPIRELSNSSEDIIKTVKFVQDEIRYLGFEDGISAYKPHHPAWVLAQRYGDCKDKSYLLATLLQQQGVKAYPVLVNTVKKETILACLPTNQLFDHCIITIFHNGEQYFIDPTANFQGGNLASLATTNYKKGLVISESDTTLTDIKNKQTNTFEIDERIIVTDFDSPAKLKVNTKYFGAKSNDIRSYFQNNAYDFIKKEYANFYSSLYSGVSLTDTIVFIDNNDINNKVETKENYQINFWEDSPEDSSTIIGYTKPIYLTSLIEFPSSSERTMPYYLGDLFKFTQKTTLQLPEEWSIEDFSHEIKNSAFVFNISNKNKGNIIIFNTSFELLKEHIPADSVPQFLKQIEEVKSNLLYYVTYNQSIANQESEVSYITLVILTISLIIGTIICLKIYYNYKPEVKNKEGKVLSIGGWLILPAIGLIATPFVLIYNLFLEGNYTTTVWNAIEIIGLDNTLPAYLLIGGEVFYNSIFLCFTVMLIFMFFNRRRALPHMITVFYLANIIIPIIDHLLIENYLSVISTGNHSEIIKSSMKSIIGAFIWIPYFLVSERSKNTFVFPLSEEPTSKIEDSE